MVTLPVHPLVGQTLPVRCRVRSQDGRRYFDVEAPDGRCLRLPADWTDQGSPRVAASMSCQADMAALRELRTAVDALLWNIREDVLDTARGSSTSSMIEHPSNSDDAPALPPEPHPTLDDGSAGGGVGDAGASNPVSHGGGR